MRENTIQYTVVDAHPSELNTTRNYRSVAGRLLRVSETIHRGQCWSCCGLSWGHRDKQPATLTFTPTDNFRAASETNKTQKNPPLEDRLQLFTMTWSLSASWLSYFSQHTDRKVRHLKAQFEKSPPHHHRFNLTPFP